jgi:hypothetical protein
VAQLNTRLQGLALINLSGVPVDERIKLMSTLLAIDKTADVEYTINRMSGSELKEFASRCIRMLAESRLELADVKGI